MLTALLFDLDGTLTDTDSLHLQAFRQLLRDHDGRELSQAQFEAQVSGRANGELFAELFPGASTEQCARLADRKEALFREMSPALQPMPGLLRLLEHAQAHAIGMCVVTNAPRLNAEHMLAAMGLAQRFEQPAGAFFARGRAGAGFRGLLAGGGCSHCGRYLYRRRSHHANA